MAILKVKYKVEFEQTISWPDDELYFLNYDSLCCNLHTIESCELPEIEIVEIEKNGEEFDF